MTTPPWAIDFIKVGRNKKSWRLRTVEPPSDDVLAEEVIQSGALVSRDVNVVTDRTHDGSITGAIYAGMRSVGSIRATRELVP